VPGALPDRWTLLMDSSRARLPRLLDEVGDIELFVHDSLHTRRNVLFELTTVWGRLSPGGAMLVDDIHRSLGFHAFLNTVDSRDWLAVPRAASGGLWGMVVKRG
jgi:hypothetical protein